MAFYIAYGSNMDIAQMERRCPGAKLVGKAMLNNWQLMFKTSCTGAYATIERGDGYTVPVLVWEINHTHEKSLDKYEGCPRFYYKRKIRIAKFTHFNGFKIRPMTGIIYIMHEYRLFNLPSLQYYKRIKNAYERFEFDVNTLDDAIFFTYDKVKERNKNKKVV